MERSVTQRALERSFDSACPCCTEHFSDLVTPHLGPMRRAARQVLPSPDLAEDAVQEVLLQVWTRGWLPAAPGPALVWLARRGALHLARSLRRRCQHENGPCPSCLEQDEMLEPSARLELAELGEALRRAIASLQAQHREVLELARERGSDYRSLATRLAVPVGTVRSRLHRARAALRRELALAGCESITDWGTEADPAA